MTDTGAAQPLGSSGIPAMTGDHATDTNPEVRFERSDVEPRGVVIFVVVLIVMLVVCSVGLVGLFHLYENQAVRANAKDILPLAKTDQDRLPTAPRLEGIDPSADAGRAWPERLSSEESSPWFGYNVRVVPADGPGERGNDMEERDRLAAEAIAIKLKKVDTTIAELAGKLRARPGGTPPDLFRLSAGEGNGGRSAREKSP